MGAAVAQLLLLRVRRRRLRVRPAAVLPGGLDRAPGVERRQRVTPAELPPPPGLLEGRESEIGTIADHLSRPNPSSGPRVIVMHGDPGVGKSALAVTLAHLVAEDYRHGQLMVRFDTGQVDSITSLVGALVTALKGPKEDVPEHKQAQWYRDYTARRQVLVILDNVEKISQVEPLLPGGRDCLVLVTSRVPLPISGDQLTLPLRPLGTQAATRLLDRLVGGVRVSREPDQAAHIVAATGGYPVAIHMAGTVLAIRRNWTLEIAVRRMNEVAEMRHGADGGAFAGVLDLAFAFLTKQEQIALVALGLHDQSRTFPWALLALLEGAFPGGLDGQGELEADVHGVKRTAVTLKFASQLLDRLARGRFVERRVDDDSGALTFRVPVYVRRYAQTHLDNFLSAQQQREALDSARRVTEKRVKQTTEDSLRATVYLLLTEGKLDAALDQAREWLALCQERASASPRGQGGAIAIEESLTLAALAEVYAELGWVDEGLAAAEQARERGGQSPHTLTRALRVGATLKRRYHQIPAAKADLLRALSCVERSDDRSERIRVLRELASTLALGDEPEQAAAFALEARTLCDEAGAQGRRHRPGVLLAYGRALQAAGKYQDAAAQLSEAEKLTADPKDNQPLVRSWIRLQYALVLLSVKEFGQARQLSLSALDGFSALRHRYGAAHARLALGRVYLAEDATRDRPSNKAIPVLEESYGTLLRCGDRWIEADCSLALAEAYQAAGRVPEARDLLSSAEQTFNKLDDLQSRRRASYLLWSAESSSFPPQPLRQWRFAVKERAGREPADEPSGIIAVPSRPIGWPAS